MNALEFMALYADRIKRAMDSGTEPKPILGQSGEIVISFDKKYKPFIPSDRGYNYENQRLRLRECGFTKYLGLDLQQTRISLEDMAGGRVFIRADGSYIKLRDGELIKFSNLGLS